MSLNISTSEFTKLYTGVPALSYSQLIELYKTYENVPEYLLFLSFVARNIVLKDDSFQNKLYWANKALTILDIKNKKRLPYGDNDDYLNSFNSSILLKIDVLMLSENITDLKKACDLGESILNNGYSSIVKGSDQTGINLSFQLIEVYNRLTLHDKAINLSLRIQKAAQENNLLKIEARASLYWSLSTLYLAKYSNLNGNKDHWDAMSNSAKLVLESLISSNIDMSLNNITSALLNYINFLNDRTKFDPLKISLTTLNNSKWIFIDLIESYTFEFEYVIFDYLNE